MKKNILVILIITLTLNIKAFAMPSDFSAYVMPGDIQFQVIDPFNNTTGYNPVTKSVLVNIPNTLYALFDEPDSGTRTKNNSMYIAETKVMSNMTQIDTGKYKIKVFGAHTLENMTIYFKVFYQNIRGVQIIAVHPSIIYPNVTWTYEIVVPEVPPATRNVPLIKVSNPQDLITDINAAGSLNFIGNPKFVSELTKEINEIEADKAKGKVDDGLTPAQKAKKEYTELLSDITEKYNKPEAGEYVKKEAYDVLKEDLDYIISHIQ